MESNENITPQEENSGIQMMSIDLSVLDNSNYYIGENRDVSYDITSTVNRWVNYGPNNDLPYYLSSLALGQGATTHFTVLRFKKNLCAGGGFLFDETNTKLKNFIQKNNLNKVLAEVCWERVIFQAHALTPILDGNKLSTIKSLTIPSLRCPLVDEQDINYYFVSKDWRNLNMPGNTPKTYKAYNIELSDTTQILYDYAKTPNNYFYAVEDYRSGLMNINTEINLTTHWLATTMNSMNPSGILSIQGDPKKEEMQDFKRNLNRQNTGPTKGGQLMVMFYKQGQNKPEFQPMIGSGVADIYNALNENTKQAIMSCHGLNSPQLAGVPGGGSIFTDSLASSIEYFQKTIIKDYQEPILETFARIFIDYGLIKDKSEIGIKSLSPTQFIFDKDVMLATLSKDEIRGLAGYKPVDAKNQKPSIAEVVGVGGLQSIVGLLSSPITNEQKMGTLVRVFNISEEDAKDIVFGLAAPIGGITPENKSLFQRILNPFKSNKK